jgi:tRNA pseudouridine38-40 synthase
MQRYFLEVSYYGAAYSGFQVQENANSVQEEVEKAIQILQKKQVTLTGSSEQILVCMHCRIIFTLITMGKLIAFCIKRMPYYPAILSYKNLVVAADAHCRFDAIS